MKNLSKQELISINGGDSGWYYIAKAAAQVAKALYGVASQINNLEGPSLAGYSRFGE